MDMMFLLGFMGFTPVDLNLLNCNPIFPGNNVGDLDNTA
jgi:hypothetical protein